MEWPTGAASSAMALPQALYRTVLRAVRAFSPAMKGDSKLARGLRGRRHAHVRLIEWGRRATETDARTDDPSADQSVDQPVLWVHASSVGESFQIRAVIDVLRVRMPGLRVVFTFFSPSAEEVCRDFPADICSYLPWDLPEVMGPVLDAVRPDVIAFTQREVWPTLSEVATRRGVPSVLLAGTLPEGAGRLSRPGRILLTAAFRNLRSVAAISEEDGERFGVLGLRSDRVTVTGDPGVDAVRDRAAEIDRGAPHMRVFGAELRGEGGPILVAGSTWPSDEEVLLPALARVRRSVPGLRLVLVPHEPDGYDFASLRRALVADGWAPGLLREVEGADGVEAIDALLVDRLGVLADLYSLAAVAYVGGGFHSGGLHSVLEPAAVAVPVLMGPRYHGSVHACRLVADGAALAVADADALALALEERLDTSQKIDDPGRRGMAYIENHRGAAEETADLITQFLPQENRWGTLSEGET